MAYPNGRINKYQDGAIVSCSRPLTNDERTALQSELTTNPEARPYRDGDALAASGPLLNALNGSYATDNPSAQGTVQKQFISPNDFGIFFATAMGRVEAGATTDPGKTLLAKWEQIKSDQVPIVKFQTEIPAASVTFQGVLAQLVSDGVMTQDEVDAFTSEPDPSWQAQIVSKARSSVIFTSPLTLEESDLEGMV